MKIKYDKVESVELHLPGKAVNEITINRLNELISPGEYLRKKNGKVYLAQDDPDWRHGSISEVQIREATSLDIAVFEVLKALSK